jgi:hypothetical protein
MCRHLEKRIDFCETTHGTTSETKAKSSTTPAAQPHPGERPSVSWLVEASKRRHGPPPKTSPLHFLSSPLSASGRASAGWWKRPGVARLPVRNKTPPPSWGLVNEIGRLVRGPAARVPPLPHKDVWSTDRVSLWERVGVRAKTPRPWGRTYWFVPPLRPQPQTNVDRANNQRHGRANLRVSPAACRSANNRPPGPHNASREPDLPLTPRTNFQICPTTPPDLRVRPLRANPRTTVLWAAPDLRRHVP